MSLELRRASSEKSFAERERERESESGFKENTSESAVGNHIWCLINRSTVLIFGKVWFKRRSASSVRSRICSARQPVDLRECFNRNRTLSAYWIRCRKTASISWRDPSSEAMCVRSIVWKSAWTAKWCRVQRNFWSKRPSSHFGESSGRVQLVFTYLASFWTNCSASSRVWC